MTTDKTTSACKLAHPTFEAMRSRVIEAAKAEIKATYLSFAYDVHRRTAFRWLADFYKDGEQMLKVKPTPGRQPKLDEPQMQSLTPAITDQTPLYHAQQQNL